MPLLTLTRARLAFGHHLLLDDADFQLDARERVGLIGRNGSGKSSLLGVIAGNHQLDDGELWISPHARIALVAQEPDLDPQCTVFDTVALGLGAQGQALADYHHAAMQIAEDPDNAVLVDHLGKLQATIENSGGWTLGNRVDAVLSRLDLPPDALVGTLSGGWKKRVALAQALAVEPDVLLLDEPTNHLDIDAIAWLETLLQGFTGALVCITHDRRFLDATATRIVELDRGRLRSYPDNFATYQEKKAQQLAEEAVTNAKFDKLLAQEEVWIRRGIEARRTRNEGRVRRLQELRRDRMARRERLGEVRLRVDDSERSGQMVAELSHVSKAFGERLLIGDFTTRVLRGDRIGLIGRNGAGKTTLLKLIMGELQPDSGTVRRGANLAVAYFDQLREQLHPDATVQDTINPGADFVQIGNERRHVITYLGDFLFSPERARSPIRSLSGGEHSRLLLARLFSQPANVLVLDEPANDLDIETLELLESLLQEYRGTIFLISHDRAFLDNVVTQVIAFEGNGVLREYAGGYSDWMSYRMRIAADEPSPLETIAHDDAIKPPSRRQTRGSESRSKLSVNEERELAGLPAQIEAFEARIASLHEQLADPALYRHEPDRVKHLSLELAQADTDLVTAYARWEDLESRTGSDKT